MSSISGFNSTQPVSSTGTDAFSDLTSAEFLQIIFTELANQDPFEPNDTQAMLDQLSSIRAIEADTQFSNQLSQLVRQNELAAASGLIGSLVSGITLDNRRVADLVVSVTQTDQGPVLNMFDGSRMFFSNIDEIVGPLDDDPDGPDPDDGPDDPGGPTDPPTEPPPVGGLPGLIDPDNIKNPDADNVTPTDPDGKGQSEEEILVSPHG
ncbi:MAG: flagellar hook capping FlgD N-terminal domain-containing protein [Phycisphaerales bacterium]